MNHSVSWNLDMSSMQEELVRDRIRTLHREAEEQRLISGVLRVRRARRDAERASSRLRHALLRLV
ncbi:MULTISPECIES: hypothetical protein [Streptosporangium]|uniref:ABC-type uncharacterized transport system ATPase subunit n=1 Tax=Streptosporangium brasiliense TaxID=47480 RepID=A0ABT9R7K4_9ACTN|nr:hypothetical protein [Streptosporangium brasiliense]MDP9865229.1 ABC-type uncharacterized transport system ATPase subunit [Streptosporangium brasiliense]